VVQLCGIFCPVLPQYLTSYSTENVYSGYIVAVKMSAFLM